MLDVVILLATGLIGLVLSYVVVTMLNIGSETDQPLARDLQQLVMQTVTLGSSTVMLPFKGTWNVISDVVLMLVNRGKWTFGFMLLTSITFLMHYYHSEMLSI